VATGRHPGRRRTGATGGRSGAAEDARRRAAAKNLLQPLAVLAGDFRRRIRAGLRDRGHQLQPSQSAVLVHLAIDGSRPGELARRAGVSKQAMGKIVDELQAVGYVGKIPDPADGRARVIRFTDRGLELLEDSAQIIDGIWRDYAALVGERRLAALRDELDGLLLRVTQSDRAGGER